MRDRSHSLMAKMGERNIDAEGLASYVIKMDGGWKIRHFQPSSRRRRRE